ncbi:MAG: DUF3160 domain-containing protein [Acidobacteriota bacterium]
MTFKTKKGTLWLLIFLLIANGLIFGVSHPDEFSLQKLELIDQLGLEEKALNLLKKNGFVVKPGYEKEIWDVYLDCKKNNHPIFITTDAVLHTSHVFFDTVLRILEIQKLNGFAEELTERMLKNSINQYKEADDKEVRKAARLNIGFFSVAQTLFRPEYETGYKLDDLVNDELKNISEHKGIKFRVLLDYIDHPSLMNHPYAYEDYSQYIPRGHYTRNEVFRKYFKVMMWYGRIDFKLRPGKQEEDVVHGKKMTLQALLMVDALMKDERAYQLWKRIYKPTVFFVGKTDDLNVKDYISLIKKVFPGEKDIDKYHQDKLLSEFTKKALEIRPPRILSGISYREDGKFEQATLGFRFMGQRFIPDSYIFQQLVYGVKSMKYRGNEHPFTMEVIPNAGSVRAFPRGLDVMAVLGSQRALEILDKEGDTDFEGYEQQMNKLKKDFSSLQQKQWNQNLYWQWLHSLIPLLKESRNERTPDFMKSQAWSDKKLMTALGSWTELRHDTILYAKQSYTALGRAPMPQPRLTYGYVEPYPLVYQRVKNMMTDLKNINSELEMEIPEVQDKIDKFEKVLERLAIISKKELEEKSLTKEEYSFIWQIGSTLKELTRFPEFIQSKIASEADEQMDLIADVHTDPNTSQVLEEGVGSPFHIYVIIKDHKGYRLTHGSVFSYYEFKHPIEDRLTDEKWQEMGKNNQRPPLPRWTQSFIAVPQAFQKKSLDFYSCSFRIYRQLVSH